MRIFVIGLTLAASEAAALESLVDLIKAADQAERDKDYDTCVRKRARAHAIDGDPVHKYYIGRCYDLWAASVEKTERGLAEDRLVKAIEHYEFYLAKDPGGLYVQRVKELLDTALKRLHEMQVNPPPPLSPACRTWWDCHTGSTIAFGSAVALAGGAVAAGFWAKGTYGDVSQSCAGSPNGCDEEDINSVKSGALVTNVFAGTAGAAAAVGVVLLLLESREPATNESVTVSAAPGGVSVHF